MLQQPKEIEKEKYTEEDYDNMLDECYPSVEVCGISFDPSRVLKELDPIAYRCGFSDYQEYETVWECPICQEEHEEEDDALLCCQDYYQCPICQEEYEDETEANECCKEEEEEEEEKCENFSGDKTCSDYFTCCDCGGNDCGCAYCWSCNACDTCKED